MQTLPGTYADYQPATGKEGLFREESTVDILGIPICNVTLSRAIERLRTMAMSGSPHHAVTVNPEFVMMARQNEQFRKILCQASLSLPDGIGIVLAARILGQPIKERVAGVDTVLALARMARDNGLAMFLLGAAPGVAERTAGVLQEQNPGLRIAGTYAGSPDAAEEDDICCLIEAADPQILLVAYGAPRQDLWIARTQARLRIPVAMGVGGSFDFIAGVSQRAPVWIRRIGLEWLHRLIREPYRWRRMLSLPQFVLAVLSKRLTLFATSPGGQTS